MDTVYIKYCVESKVKIPELNIYGIVESISICSKGVRYYVKYSDNNGYKRDYFFESELGTGTSELWMGVLENVRPVGSV